jgi:hypothetical protein
VRLEIASAFSVRTLEVETEIARYVMTRVNLPGIGDGWLLAAYFPPGMRPTRHRSIDAGRTVNGEHEPRFETLEQAIEAAAKDAAGLNDLSREVMA